MAGYTRQSTYTDGDVIQAADSNNEFDALLDSFNNATGHAHDGTAAEGPVIGLIGDAGNTVPLNKLAVDTANDRLSFYVDVASTSVEQLRVEDGIAYPVTTNDIDLGTAVYMFKDGYFAGTLESVNLEVTNLKAKDGAASATIADSTGVMTITSAVLTTADINAGTIDNATIGGTTPAAGDFTTLGATGNITVGGTVDGRDVAADGTKLDGVEALADVTDVTNVTAAGALMDSELTDIASVKALNQGVATADSPTFVTVNATTVNATTVDINGGTIDGTVIGGTTAAAGSFTTGSFTGDVSFGDDAKALFGTGSDLQIFHDGSNSWIRDKGTGGLVIDTDGTSIDIKGSSPTEYMARFIKDGEVSLYYDNAEKLATTSTGVDVTGTITSDGLGIGTALNPAKLSVQTADLGTTAGDSVQSLNLRTNTTNGSQLLFTTERTSTGTDWTTAAHKIQRKVDATLMGYMQFGSQNSDLITFGADATEYMRIDSGGRVTMPYQPSFKVAASYSTPTLISGATLSYTVEEYDIGNNFANSKFTAPVAGVYHFDVSVFMYTATAASGYSYIALTKNDNIIFPYSHSDAQNITSYDTLTLSRTVQLAAGDWVEVYVYNDASHRVYNGFGYNHFSGHLIG